ncbi:unnamed protein product [Schistocephalus solidus]|uniref:Uncharacterized protein n=1 Tax=Schistocephalus solidus TaxID=70667 RepID=A0A183SY24_SCHSO|nr:unnamed protein product [Schistocephalus solidus]
MATPASEPTTTTTPTTDNHLIDAPTPRISDTILHPPPLAPITATSVDTSDNLPPPPPPPPPPLPVPAIGTRHIHIHVSEIHRDAKTSCPPIKTAHSPPTSLITSTSNRALQTQHLPTYPVLIVTAHAYHASAWLVTYGSIAQRPAYQCQMHQHTPAAPYSTLRPTHAHSHTVCTY